MVPVTWATQVIRCRAWLPSCLPSRCSVTAASCVPTTSPALCRWEGVPLKGPQPFSVLLPKHWLGTKAADQAGPLF